MKFTFRWFGSDDLVQLEHIRQIPCVTGIVTAVYDVPVGEEWSLSKIMELKESIERKGLQLEVIESVPVHEDIKLGLPTRDGFIENYKNTLRNLSKAGIKVVCYNFMPIFDWTRTNLYYELEDGSTALLYEESVAAQMNPLNGDLRLPGWDTSYTDQHLKQLFGQYEHVNEEQLWANLTYFLKAIIPVAEEEHIQMAIHPDDPPWSIFGLPRIITNKQNLERLINIIDSPSNGLCMCSGSLGANADNDFIEMLSYFMQRERVHFVHARNIKRVGEMSFYESSHRSEDGSLDMVEILKVLHTYNYSGPIRPDHGRMIWGEEGKPGYGLYDRALGITYLNGIWETLSKISK
ncbi:mannonate dehydratase [Paenibacillus sp. SYP-B3998]|uniref:Mannonate dehydratase n=1 Tax=Paenibacillus sp. SYP-B3998 TaxID=2678564 RepID=A0A6G3ZYQ2_9BACL|nr:mannonate dehydratase [Paenibacillus sp. SYP-B3998]NEW06709.1 mannonate dehydratase [Paenibacillus sp. SYP-B3998]